MKKSLFAIFSFFVLTFFFSALVKQVAAQPWIQRGSTLQPEANMDRAGYSVSMNHDGSTIAILAPDNAGFYGQVRVYNWSGGNWVQKGPDVDGDATAQYPESVSLSSDGNTFAVGGWHDTKVYSWIGNNWVQKGTNITFSNNVACVCALSDDGNTLLLGDATNATAGFNAGAVAIYSWNGSSWVQKGSQINGLTGSEFGHAVSINNDGTVIAAGATYGSMPDLAFARIYNWNGSAWVQKGSDLTAAASLDWFGYAISLNDDGNTVAVGAALDDGAGTDAGNVRVYNWNINTWVQKGTDIDGQSAYDNSGSAVYLTGDGNTLAVGSPFNDPISNNEGQVRVYNWNGSSWLQKGYDIEGTDDQGALGLSVCLSNDGNVLLTGVPGAGFAAGGLSKCYVFNNVGVVENNFVTVLKLYPNPGNKEFHISLGAVQRKLHLTISDMLGAEVYKKSYSSTDLIQFELDAPAGNYFVKLQGENNQAAVFKVQKL